MNRSDTIGELAAALAQFQASVPPIKKGRTARIPGKDGKQGYSYLYADLADIMASIAEPLAANGLSVSNNVASDGGVVVVSALLMHKSGEWIQTDLLTLPSGNTPQTAGSAITYGRRYTTSAVLGLVTEEDDDGAGATHSAEATRTDDLASEPQRKAIWAISKKLGITEDKLHAGIKRDTGKDHVDQLTKSEASALIEKLKKLEEAEKAKEASDD